MSKVRKSVLILASLVMTAGLSFGAPVHWPKLHHKAKQDQSADTQKATKQKKSHHWLHHEKKSKKTSTSDSQ
jgi:hypothetical protein